MAASSPDIGLYWQELVAPITLRTLEFTIGGPVWVVLLSGRNHPVQKGKQVGQGIASSQGGHECKFL